jgi:hypothetical protein
MPRVYDDPLEPSFAYRNYFWRDTNGNEIDLI